ARGAGMYDEGRNEGSKRAELFWSQMEGPAVEFVEVEFTAKQLSLNRFGRASAVKCSRESNSDNQRDDCQHRNERARLFFGGECEKVSGEKCKSTERCQNCEHNQRRCHDGR